MSSSIEKICKYYDNRHATVTITADDWADYCHEKFIQACQNFRSYNLWYSVAIITGWTSGWDDIQNQLDLGLVEPVAHSRTHPYVPYDDVEGEVLGSKQDIIDNLNLLNHNRSGVNEYIYSLLSYISFNSSIYIHLCLQPSNFLLYKKDFLVHKK